MVQIRIPGLDHSLSTEGEWIPDDSFHRRNYDYRDTRNLAAKRKAERLREQGVPQLHVRDAMATRGVELRESEAET